MRYCYFTETGALIATVERQGNGTAKAPVRWAVRWSLSMQAAGATDERHTERAAAAAAVLRRYPNAALTVYNKRGDLLRAR